MRLGAAERCCRSKLNTLRGLKSICQFIRNQQAKYKFRLQLVVKEKLGWIHLQHFRHTSFARLLITVHEVKAKVKRSHYRPGQVLRVPRGWGSQISRQLTYESSKVASLTHRPSLSSGNISGTHFCYRLSRPQGRSAAQRIMSIKNSNDTMGNRSRDIPICSAVPQPLRQRVIVNKVIAFLRVVTFQVCIRWAEWSFCSLGFGSV
jgi:hypothetical protein